MTIHNLLLPHKHVRFCDSLLALAGHLRRLLGEPRTVDELWALLDRDEPGWPAKPTFTQLVLAITLLFAISQITSSGDGRIRLASDEAPAA